LTVGINILRRDENLASNRFNAGDEPSVVFNEVQKPK
jgi:hypothetical protein